MQTANCHAHVRTLALTHAQTTITYTYIHTYIVAIFHTSRFERNVAYLYSNICTNPEHNQTPALVPLQLENPET